MREILFRAKLKNESGWVYGDLVHNAFDGTFKIINTGIAIEGCYPFDVNSETVGQFTGLLDKNGAKIFEGDKTDLGEIVIFSNGSFKTTYEGDTQGGGLLTEMRCKHITIIRTIHVKE